MKQIRKLFEESIMPCRPPELRNLGPYMPCGRLHLDYLPDAVVDLKRKKCDLADITQNHDRGI